MKKKTRFLLFLVLMSACLSGGFYASKYHVERTARQTLTQFGFNNAAISKTSFYGSFIVLENIKLDSEGFSTIDSIRLEWSSALPFTGKKSFIIDGLSLTGEINAPYRLDITGWNNSLPQSRDVPDITLNDAKIDLMTPSGAIRLQAKGLVQQQENGIIALNGALWGVQHQLDIDTRWTGSIKADGSQSYDIDILKGKLNLEHLAASRVTGKAVLDWPATESLPALDGTLQIGMLVLGGNPFSSVKLQFKGPPKQQEFVMEGYIPAGNIMQGGVKIEQLEANTQIQAAINARSLDDLMAFLHQVRGNVNRSTWGVGYFMPLMLTEGNLDRIEKDMGGISYDELQLVITGDVNDMTGKIIAYKKNNGSGERHIISLDPGFSAQ